MHSCKQVETHLARVFGVFQQQLPPTLFIYICFLAGEGWILSLLYTDIFWITGFLENRVYKSLLSGLWPYHWFKSFETCEGIIMFHLFAVFLPS